MNPNTSHIITQEKSDLTKLVNIIEQLPRPVFISIDGHSGAGKSNLAHILSQEIPHNQILEVENWVAGWHDLAGGINRLEKIVKELSHKGKIQTTHWDWEKNQWGKPYDLLLQPVNFLVGCGSSAISTNLSLWVQADENERKKRVKQRDNYDWSNLWEMWAKQEQEILNIYHGDKKADFIIKN